MSANHPTPAELDALLEAARAATPGPWYYKHPFSVAIDDDSNPSFMRRMLIQLPERVQPLSDTEATQCERDYRYLAAANPATITHLVLMVRELQERLRVKPEIEAVALSGIKEGIRQREQNAVEHFRVRAVRAIQQLYEVPTPHNVDISLGYAEGLERATKLIESLPLVETEE